MLQYNDDAPETAHILWTKPLASGGLAGGDTGPHAIEDGDAYEGKFEYSVIMNGILYYNRFAAVERGGLPQQGDFCRRPAYWSRTMVQKQH